MITPRVTERHREAARLKGNPGVQRVCPVTERLDRPRRSDQSTRVRHRRSGKGRLLSWHGDGCAGTPRTSRYGRRVGTWGPGAFDSDDALDLLDTLTEQDAAARRESLGRIFRAAREHPDDLNWTLIPGQVGCGRYVRHAPVVRRILLARALFLVPGSSLWALLPLIATSRLGLGPGGYGVLLAPWGPAPSAARSSCRRSGPGSPPTPWWPPRA